MALQVFKFGGTSLNDAAAIRRACDIARARRGDGLALVVSAMGGVTDLLLGTAAKAKEGDASTVAAAVAEFQRRHLAAIDDLVASGPTRAALHAAVAEAAQEFASICQSVAVIRELTAKTTAKTVARGERLMARIVQAALVELGTEAVYVDAFDVIQVSEGLAGLAPEPRICEAQAAERILPHVKSGKIVVMPGFIGRGPDGEVITLGRGGSDYSATILGASLNAGMVTLYKEVDGLLTADPRYVKAARIVPELHFREAAELAYYGAKVLHPRSIIPLVAKGIPLNVRNTFNPEFPGTRIAADVKPGAYPVKALTAIPSQALVSVEGKGMMGVPGIAGRTFSTLAKADISVSVISQGSSESSICFVVAEADAEAACRSLEAEFRFEREHSMIDSIRRQSGVAVVALVGLGMSGTRGIAARAFGALAREHVNIMAIAQGSSELSISIVIAGEQMAAALGALHKEYQLDKIRALPERDPSDVQVAVFGLGQIGRSLVGQITAQQEYFQDKMGLSVRVVGLADSSGLVVREGGYSAEELDEYCELKQGGQKLDASAPQRRSIAEFAPLLKTKLWSLPLGRGIFVDLTAEETAPLLKEALDQGMHVALANKKPLAVAYDEYQAMLETARRRGVMLRYEATVGAGLPVLDTIAKLESAGDRIEVILGCLSGTLGYLMTEVEDGTAFSEAVKRAFKLGYTEPDPRDDLSGMDVARKGLILARSLGYRVDLADVAVESLFSAASSDDDPQKFMANLQAEDAAFKARIDAARRDGKVLRYVARIAPGDVRVGLEAVPLDSPLGRLRGTANQVSIRTRRYSEANPLIVTGPGAGADVTAAGVLNDIIAIASSFERS